MMSTKIKNKRIKCYACNKNKASWQSLLTGIGYCDKCLFIINIMSHQKILKKNIDRVN